MLKFRGGAKYAPPLFIKMIPPVDLVARYTGLQSPGGLAVLDKTKFDSGPKAVNPPPITSAPLIPPGAGIYDENGKLPQIQGKGLDFLAYA